MKKSVWEMFEDYVEMRLKIGGCLLNIIITVAILWGLVVFVKDFVTDFLEGAALIGWLFWIALALFFATLFGAIAIGCSRVRNRSRKAGMLMMAGSVLQFVLAFLQFGGDDWTEWITVIATAAFGVGLLVIGCKALATKD